MIALLVWLIQAGIFGFAAQHVAESKGYDTGFAWGFWLGPVGLIVVAAKPNQATLPVQTEQVRSMLLQLADGASAPDSRWQCACGAKNPAGVTVCQSCGQPRRKSIADKARCPHCGALTNKQNPLCFACNQPWAASAEEAPSTQAPAQTPVVPASAAAASPLPPRVDIPTDCLFRACYQPTLEAVMSRTKEQCYRYNRLSPNDRTAQTDILRGLLGHMGEQCVIMPPFWCDYGYNISVGSCFYANHDMIITDGARVTFGDHVFVGPRCCFTTAEHALDAEQRRAGMEVAKPITVGNDVWIGAGSTVLAGVTIGDGAVIGAGSVVTRDIPGGVVAVGVPCRVRRTITEADKTRYPLYQVRL